MSFGFWGSRFPLGNLASSALITCLVSRRLAWLRLKNRFKMPLNKQVQLVNGLAQERVSQEWLAKKYDKFKPRRKKQEFKALSES